MNKIGIHFGYWNRNWDTDFISCINRAAKVGLDILEVAPGPFLIMSKEKRKEIKEAAKSQGIELTYSVGLGHEYDLASENVAIRQNGIKHTKEIMRLMGEMESTIYSGINYSAWNKSFNYGIEDKEAYFERAALSLKEIMVVAEEYNINYCLEVVNRFEQYLLNTAVEGVKLVEMVDSPNIKILLDTFHMNIEENSFEEAIRTASKYLGHVHIGEANRRLPCEGRMPWDSIICTLKEIGYKNALVMEPFIKMGGEVGRDIKVWRDLSNGANECRMDELVRESIAFIKNKI
jgi:D-psicose/D-tagatose/L-ribulose 3-epimerase